MLVRLLGHFEELPGLGRVPVLAKSDQGLGISPGFSRTFDDEAPYYGYHLANLGHLGLHPWRAFLLLLELLAAPAGSRLDHFVLKGDSLIIFLDTNAPTASCPLCGPDARRIHSRYSRRFADLSCFGRAVQVQVTVRWFFCAEPKCPRRIFAERLSGFAVPYARTTSRLTQTHQAIGCALGGEAGSRLTIRLSVATSPDTLLRRVKQLKNDSAPPLRFVGIDDWAWRKGQRYGTIVVDLERGDVVDLLPDRNAKTVKQWLDDHPGVELISRDRWSSYAQAAAEAAREPRQVADRWHLLKNLREAIERLFDQHSPIISEALKTAETPSEAASKPTFPESCQGQAAAEPSSPQLPNEPCPTSIEPGMAEPVEPSSSQPPSEPALESPRLQAQRARRRRRVERFEQVHQRHRQGHSERRIARENGYVAKGRATLPSV